MEDGFHGTDLGLKQRYPRWNPWWKFSRVGELRQRPEYGLATTEPNHFQ